MARQVPMQSELDRLTADLRVFDANGIERAAWGWDRHERRGLDAYHAAERAALAQIEQRDLGPRWEEFRRTLFGLTEGAGALVSWKAKHGQQGHKAERAAFGAALGLFARGTSRVSSTPAWSSRWPRLFRGSYQTARPLHERRERNRSDLPPLKRLTCCRSTAVRCASLDCSSDSRGISMRVLQHIPVVARLMVSS